MPDEFPDTPVDGDGVITVVDEEDEMSTDLPAAVAQQLMTETVGNIQGNNSRGRDAATQANNVLMFASARNFDELGTVESRATSGVIATPIASPTTQT